MLKPTCKTFLTAVAMAIIGLTALTQQASAYMDPKAQPKLDMKVKMSKDEFLRSSDLVEATVSGDESLSYRVRVPKGWIKLPVAKTDELMFTAEIFKTVATYLSPPQLDTRSTFRIRALELKKFISAENWFLNYILTAGSTVEGFNFRSVRRVEAQYTLLDKRGQSFSVRAIAEITGARIVLAEYMVPSEYLETERDMQVWTMMSFQLTRPELGPIEKVDTYAFVDIVKFLYPRSWLLYAPPIISIDRMEATVLNIPGVNKEQMQGQNVDISDSRMDGRIDIHVISKSVAASELAEIERLRERFRKRGFEIGDLISSVDPVPLHEGVKQSKIDAYKIGIDNTRLIGYEVWVALLETRGRYYLLSLITPGRNEDFYLWAQNTATFKYMMGTLAPVNDSAQ